MYWKLKDLKSDTKLAAKKKRRRKILESTAIYLLVWDLGEVTLGSRMRWGI